MSVDKMKLLEPNYMGTDFENTGLDTMTANYGYGVPELMKANQQAAEDQSVLPNPAMEKLRRHKAREFGLTKETVGF